MTSLGQRYNVQQEPLRSERRAELALLAAILLLILLCAWGLFRFVSPSLVVPIPPAADSMLVADVTGAGVVTAEQRNEIQARPLFWPSRQPLEAVVVVEPENEQAKSSAKPLKGVTLTGVFGGGEQAGIIVHSQGKKRRLMVGEELNGWILDAVEPTQVTFVDGANEAVLSLKRGKLAAQSGGPGEAGGSAASAPPGKSNGAPASGGKANGAAPAGKPVPLNSRYRAKPVVPGANTGGGSSLGLGGGDRNRGGDKK